MPTERIYPNVQAMTLQLHVTDQKQDVPHLKSCARTARVKHQRPSAQQPTKEPTPVPQTVLTDAPPASALWALSTALASRGNPPALQGLSAATVANASQTSPNALSSSRALARTSGARTALVEQKRQIAQSITHARQTLATAVPTTACAQPQPPTVSLRATDVQGPPRRDACLVHA